MRGRNLMTGANAVKAKAAQQDAARKARALLTILAAQVDAMESVDTPNWADVGELQRMVSGLEGTAVVAFFETNGDSEEAALKDLRSQYA